MIRAAAALALLLAAPAVAEVAPGTPATADTGLTGRYDPHNPFARIIAGTLPAVKVYEDAQTLAFMNIHPTSPGHVLVIPKAPVRNLMDIDPATLQHLILVVQRIARAEVAGLHADGINLRQNNGVDGDQTVFHFHMHVVPRYRGQAQAHPTYADPPVPPERLEVEAAKIRAALAAMP